MNELTGKPGSGAAREMETSARALFDVPEGIAYLNCANLAPRLHAVTEAGLAANRTTACPWDIAPAGWFSGAERLRMLFASIVNSEADDVALIPSVSYGIATAARNVAVAAGQCIVLLDREFPSNVYAWRELALRNDATIKTVSRRQGASWTECLLEAIDADTAVVAVPHCHWTDGTLVDLVRIGQAARAVGAALVIDASQSLGAYPLDVAEVKPDFLVTVGYKWLLGPYGLGYLYAAPHRWSIGTPIEQSWLSRAGSEDFSRLVDYTDSYRQGARRFDMGEFPQFVLSPMATAALSQVLGWGVGRIQSRLSRFTTQVVDRVTAMGGFEVPSTDRAGHMVGIRVLHGSLAALGTRLAAARVYASIRGDTLRIAPHLHNDETDVERLADVLLQHREAP